MTSAKRFSVALLCVALPFFGWSQSRNECSGSIDTLLGIYVVDYPDTDPQFPGGEVAMLNYIMENIGAPDTTAGSPTYAVVEFVVDVDGTIKGVKCPGKNFKTVSHLDWSLMKVALKMPPWIPGQCNGRAVAVRVNIPIHLSKK